MKVNSTRLLWVVQQFRRYYDRQFTDLLARSGLTMREMDVILFLTNNPGHDTARDVTELRGLSKGAVSKAVESLIQKSLLERIPDTEDRRKIHLKLKPQVGPVAESIDEVRTEFINTVLEGFTKEELKVYAGFRDRQIGRAHV